MKKTVITVFALLVLFAFTITGAMAQTWTWDDPIEVTTKVKEISGDLKSNAIYGIDNASGAVGILATGETSIGIAKTGAVAVANAKDLVVGYGGLVYTIDDENLGILNEDPNPLADQQPKIPDDDQTGVYTHIASGNNGKLYVIFETGTKQYLLTGNPPVQDVLTVKLNPQSLNLGSKGNWVTCLIQIPGNDINGIDQNSIAITNFKIDNVDNPVTIPVDLSAPYDFTTDGKLMVKFVRYNKTTSDDPESLVGALSALFPSGPSKGKFDVTATIEADHNELGKVSGEATFKVIVPKAKKQK